MGNINRIEKETYGLSSNDSLLQDKFLCKQK